MRSGSDELGVTGPEEEEGGDDGFADLLAADVPGPSAATVQPRCLVFGFVLIASGFFICELNSQTPSFPLQAT